MLVRMRVRNRPTLKPTSFFCRFNFNFLMRIRYCVILTNLAKEICVRHLREIERPPLPLFALLSDEPLPVEKVCVNLLHCLLKVSRQFHLVNQVVMISRYVDYVIEKQTFSQSFEGNAALSTVFM